MTRKNIIANELASMIREIRKGGLTVTQACQLSDKYADKIDKLYNSDKKKTCFCGAEYNGVECSKCGFDASEIDIY